MGKVPAGGMPDQSEGGFSGASQNGLRLDLDGGRKIGRKVLIAGESGVGKHPGVSALAEGCGETGILDGTCGDGERGKTEQRGVHGSASESYRAWGLEALAGQRVGLTSTADLCRDVHELPASINLAKAVSLPNQEGERVPGFDTGRCAAWSGCYSFASVFSVDPTRRTKLGFELAKDASGRLVDRGRFEEQRSRHR
jgi:hypothetical protein